MNRRSFLNLLIVAPLLGTITIHQKERKAKALARLRQLMKEAMEHWHREVDKQLFMYGVPYHHSDASTHKWLGIEREST